MDLSRLTAGTTQTELKKAADANSADTRTRARIEKLRLSVLAKSEDKVLAFRPEVSVAPQEWRAADPEFWGTKE